MNMNDFIRTWDSVVDEHDIEKARSFIANAISTAKVEGDDSALLTIYNEAMGFCRETGDKEASFDFAEKAIKQAQKMGLENHPVYATTLQNVANAYRAGGRLEDSLSCYQSIMKVYEKTLDDTDMMYATIYNNMSLLKQEQGDFATAKAYLKKAISILKQNDNTVYEEAVSYANLSSTCAVMGELDNAMEYGRKAVSLFDECKVTDAHYGAALNGLGMCCYKKGEYEAAVDYLERAARSIRETFGETQAYARVKENLAAAKSAMNNISGMELCKAFYTEIGEPMLKEKFPEYFDRMSIGLCGEGSDCLGFDDVYSRDHDWGPGFSIWIDNDLYTEIGDRLSEEYEKLPKEYRGYSRVNTKMANGRIGVCRSQFFYERILGTDWEYHPENIPESALCAATSGEIFHHADTEFEKIRDDLLNNYPLYLKYVRIAESCALFSQGAQYNYPRMMRRGDTVAARISLVKGIESGMKLLYETEGMFPPHDKWLYAGLNRIPDCDEEKMLIWKILGSNIGQETDEMLLSVERFALLLAERLYIKGITSHSDDRYLDSYTGELLAMSSYLRNSHNDLAELIAEEEFRAFDDVSNEGGRASCQNDWYTFRIMRVSQYKAWPDELMARYLYDFKSMMSIGRNPITEKYGRMMESTAPEKYEELKKNMPKITEEQMQLVNVICAIQVGMMEEYSEKNPELASRARSIHTAEDSMYNTSYETYLRGELLTYTSQMLMLYGRYIVNLQKEGKNIAEMIIGNTLELYGYGRE